MAIAVSGGGDSMALLSLYAALAASAPGWPEPLALTVDHGLRDGFAAEAELVAAYCAARGIAHRLLVWEGGKPQSGLMAAARLARYRLLADAARETGAQALLVGHTLDDCRETAAMRAARGSAAIAMESLVLFERRLMLIRPMLALTRAQLRAHLQAAGIAHADDPTNEDTRFERVRVRAGRPDARIETLASALSARAALAADAARWLCAAARLEGEGCVIAPAAGEMPAAAFALRHLVAALSQSAYPAAPATGEKLAALVLHGANGRAFSAGRLTFRKAGGVVRITPDARHPAAHGWVPGIVAPFETFCPVTMLPLADALAALLDAPAFSMADKS